MGAHKNRLIERVLLSTHNIYFCRSFHRHPYIVCVSCKGSGETCRCTGLSASSLLIPGKRNKSSCADTFYFRPPNVPWLYYFSAAGEKLSGDDILRDTYLQTRYTFDPRSNLEYRVARYSLDGSYLGIDNVFNGRLQLCADSSPRLNAAYVFGTTYSQSVRLLI